MVIVYVASVEAVFVTTNDVTSVCVAAGAVYNVVLLVEAAPRNRTVNVFAIIYLLRVPTGLMLQPKSIQF